MHSLWWILTIHQPAMFKNGIVPLAPYVIAIKLTVGAPPCENGDYATHRHEKKSKSHNARPSFMVKAEFQTFLSGIGSLSLLCSHLLLPLSCTLFYLHNWSEKQKERASVPPLDRCVVTEACKYYTLFPTPTNSWYRIPYQRYCWSFSHGINP